MQHMVGLWPGQGVGEGTCTRRIISWHMLTSGQVGYCTMWTKTQPSILPARLQARLHLAVRCSAGQAILTTNPARPCWAQTRLHQLQPDHKPRPRLLQQCQGDQFTMYPDDHSLTTYTTTSCCCCCASCCCRCCCCCCACCCCCCIIGVASLTAGLAASFLGATTWLSASSCLNASNRPTPTDTDWFKLRT